MSNVVFRNALPEDTDRCYAIEIAAYEGDEAATREKIATRIAHYPQGFLCLEIDSRVVGFINAGCAWDVVMSDEAFKELVGHDAAAPNAVIMSVVLDPDYQGQGYATLMMRHFINVMKQMDKRTVHLMCKTQHVDLYKKFGFHYIKPSDSEHGGMTWHEMLMTL